MTKNKQKTRKSAAKRFKVTGGKDSKVLHRSNSMRHLRSKKGKKVIRRLKQEKPVDAAFEKKIKQMLGEA